MAIALQFNMRASRILILLLFCFIAKSEVPVLERQVDLSFSNEPIASALEKIKVQTGAIFGYQSYVLNGVVPVTAEFRKKSIREVLNVILPQKLFYKAKGNYIILKERPVERSSSKKELSGYVYEANSDKKLANVTIYDKNTLQSVTTDEYGFYSITLPNNYQCLTVNKLNYEDTCIALIPTNETGLANITITPARTERDSLWRKKMQDFSDRTNDLFKKFKGYANTLNVKDTIDQNFQFSFIPFVGTNGRMSGSIYNKYSINLIGGYSRGNRLLELGGCFNINKENMTGAQFAGMFNIVGDSVKGLQLAGFFNVNGRSVQGVQGAGFANLNFGDLRGAQGAGFMNVNKGKVYGITGAGFMNLNRRAVRGMQVAGFMNTCLDTLRGATVAGFMNLTKSSKGAIEGAGFMNQAKHGKNNIQIAGFMNQTFSGTTRLQISGYLNQAKVVTGTQIGFLNICDSIKGVPIGFISIVKSGVHQIELSGDEVFYANFAVRTGVNKFYNVLSAGIQPGSNNLWHFGYGIGTSFKISGKWRSDVVLNYQHVSSGAFYHATSELNKLYIGLEYKIAKKVSLAFGPTLNLYITDALLPEYIGTYDKIAPYSQYNHITTNDFALKGWVGGKIALRFF
jgi:hypothetical protein